MTAVSSLDYSVMQHVTFRPMEIKCLYTVQAFQQTGSSLWSDFWVPGLAAI
jgi:hypothetical protein